MSAHLPPENAMLAPQPLNPEANSNPSSNPRSRPELLAPAGNWECARAAVENGADAVYFGLERFNARLRADNFTTDDLPELMAFLHRRGVKGYVAFNTLVFEPELPAAEAYLRDLITAGVDAAIAQDVGICRLIRHLSPDFPIHASTQMTITSAAGVEFARSLGCNLVVLARECSLKEISKVQQQLGDRELSMPLEIFVHGALCVSYSGQCLTSESLGGRSANRGECAQACRMTYELIADGETVDLGDRQYLLSPQDLAGIEVLPEVVRSGVACLKIEGRLKTPEYVANATRIYRQAIDRAWDAADDLPRVSQQDRYDLEMAFSRGLHTGWLQGINNQELVRARFGKKRGVYLGEVAQVQGDRVFVTLQAPLKAGDGVVFDRGRPQEKEEGGRVYQVEQKGEQAAIKFGKRDVNLKRVRAGDKLWKTNDPELDRRLRQSFQGDRPQFQRPISVEVAGNVGEPLRAIARDEWGNVAQVESSMPLVEARTRPLGNEQLCDKLGRLGNTPFQLAAIDNQLQGEVALPASELNRLRREFVAQLEAKRVSQRAWELRANASYRDLLPAPESAPEIEPELVVLVRNFEQLQVAIASGINTLYCELTDPRCYREAVEMVRRDRVCPEQTIWVAPPRITKPSETYILQQVRRSRADGYLIRNYDHLQFFAGDRCIGDFSFNVANAIAADYFLTQYPHLERLTASYDLNIEQLTALIASCPPHGCEVSIHQHMPMFHMEHCVFCTFLSSGTDYTNCGRPCDRYEVELRDRAGVKHVLQADAGCRNTVFNGVAQTGAEYVQRLIRAGVRHFRLEFLNESPQDVETAIARYRQLLRGEISGAQLWKELRLQNQLGVTRGSLE